MTDYKTACRNCHVEIQVVTADRNDGLCTPCYQRGNPNRFEIAPFGIAADNLERAEAEKLIADLREKDVDEVELVRRLMIWSRLSHPYHQRLMSDGGGKIKQVDLNHKSLSIQTWDNAHLEYVDQSNGYRWRLGGDLISRSDVERFLGVWPGYLDAIEDIYYSMQSKIGDLEDENKKKLEKSIDYYVKIAASADRRLERFRREAVVVRGRAAKYVRQLIKNEGQEFWEAIQQLQPQLFRAVSLTKLHRLREDACAEFQRYLDQQIWSELDWQKFFENNTWIFGYGLSYQFLSTIATQPQYGGVVVTGRGGQRGDFLAASEADRRFTVLIEIKRPDSLLVDDSLYRNKVHMLGHDLTGGVTQLQSNCRAWETQGGREDDNREFLDKIACSTIQPKGLLIIGHTRQLDSVSKRTTFELFRRNLQNPEVVTFDELLGRAKHLLLNEAKEFAVSPGSIGPDA